MREIARRTLAILLVFVLCFSLPGISALAAETQEESTESISSGESVQEEEGFVSIPEDGTSGPEGEGTPVDLGTSTVNPGTHESLGSAGPGESLGSTGLIEGDEGLGIEDFDLEDVPLPEDAIQEGMDVPGGEENDDLGFAGYSIYAAQTATVLNLNNSSYASRTINISWNQTPNKGKVCVSVWKNAVATSEAVSCSWGKVSGNTIPLTITANKTGTCYVVVYLCDKYGVPCAKAKITVNVCKASLTGASSTTVNQGATKTVTLKAAGYSGSSSVTVYSNNSTAFATSAAAKSANGDVPLKITGKQTGNGRITAYYTADTTGEVLATASFAVTVTATTTPKLTLSASSVSVEPGKSKGVTVSYSGYTGSVYYAVSTTNTIDYSASLNGQWNGNSQTLNITGKQNGSGKVYITMYASATNTKLATATISVSVAAVPVINASTGSLKLTAGGSGSVTYTFQNAGGYQLGYTISNSAICSAAWSQVGNGYKLTVAAKNAGSATIQVWLKNNSGTIVKSTNLSVTVSEAPPKLTASVSSLSLTAAETATVKFSRFNCSDEVYLGYSRSNGSVCSVSWEKSWAGNSINMYVKGSSPGTCTITVGMYRAKDKKLLTSTTVKVTVNPKSSDFDLSRLNYNFSNYGQIITRTLCQKMYGNTQVAENIYRYNIGGGGVCFGMATSSGMMYGGKIPVSTFQSGATKVSQLAQSNKSSSLGLSVKDFIECMHVSQAATAVHREYNIGKVATGMKSEIDAGRVAYLSVFGQLYSAQSGKKENCGHTVVAYDYTQSGNTLTFYIYDSNWPYARQLTMTRPSSSSAYNTWSYPITSGATWANGKTNASINYITYNTMNAIWDNRGKLSSTWNSGGQSYNLVLTTESDFTLFVRDFDTMTPSLVAKMDKGTLVESMDGVVNVPMSSVLEDGTVQDSGVYMLLVPRDYYFVQDDDDTDGITISIVDDTLSATVETNAYTEAFGFCADDTSETATVSMSGVTAGVGYTVTIGTTDPRTGASETISTSGVGTGNPNATVSLGINEGNLSLGGIGENASLEITAPEVICSVAATADEGISITPAGETSYSAGENAFYEIKADKGYSIAAVYVDGENVGPVSSWYFEDLSQSHTIHAVAAQDSVDLSACTLSLAEEWYTYDGEAKTPAVTVTDPTTGETLDENQDYMVCYNENVEPGQAQVVVLALTDSGYSGVLETQFAIVSSSDSLVKSVKAAGKTIEVTMKEAAYEQPGILTAAVYDENGKMLFVGAKSLEEYGKKLTFTLDKPLAEKNKIKLFLLDPEGYQPRQSADEITVS